ncbi:hypothetical protein CQ046_09620 [Chryseobacterium sp. MYb7]|jgi:hypothetical protein|uniref:hypothetical protein n=1 Tax=Chryseobacterium sp. MYb7 TaxID=1827290 RepID=UPI000D011237|nr:hypothetical protein [Chryseobacterium sp. MYb7]PRB03621.1 hypothetical protein CQ046_09620 [Chryseobacterium sp. MYb7]
MADKTTEPNNIISTEDNGVIKENEIKNTQLHSFFVSAIKNIYNTENEDLKLTDSANSDVELED